MKRYFVDAVHFIALANPKDQWHEKAVCLANETIEDRHITTEEVLIEFLNFYAESGEFMRQKVADLARSVLTDVHIEVISRTETSFLNALDLYESRLDKGYSLTDCISMNVCRELGIKDVLTSDRHFEQEGFSVLL
ncbi:MAG: type II toxin-antitoxin system VapC family toxin [Acidobacteria bacterium]|nr:type II toxin-antitoxin system VapC family toxin [Acidobacteriota bacterium]